jgi:hypothetical protein
MLLLTPWAQGGRDAADATSHYDLCEMGVPKV